MNLIHNQQQESSIIEISQSTLFVSLFFYNYLPLFISMVVLLVFCILFPMIHYNTDKIHIFMKIIIFH